MLGTTVLCGTNNGRWVQGRLWIRDLRPSTDTDTNGHSYSV